MKCRRDELQPHVPVELDLSLQGKAYVSLKGIHDAPDASAHRGTFGCVVAPADLDERFPKRPHLRPPQK